MFQRALLIARKDLYLRFTNRGSLLLMLAVPLLLSTIIAMVFGNLGADGGVPALRDIPLAIVNLDTGTELQGRAINYGTGLEQLLTGGAVEGLDAGACPLAAAASTGDAAELALDELFEARVLDDVVAGRTLVEEGELAALVIVPADFSARLNPRIGPGDGPLFEQAPATIEVYSDATRPLESLVARSVVQGYSERLLTGNIALGASINVLIAREPLAALRLAVGGQDVAISEAITCGFSDLAVGALATVRRIGAGQDANTDEADDSYSPATAILGFIGAAQATFFALFVAQFGVVSVIEERRAGTLQRILTTPTTRGGFLGGKLLGTWVTALAQLVLLMFALSLIASLLEGRLIFIWGADPAPLLAIILPLSLAVAGLGLLLVAFVQRPEQVGPAGSIVNIILAMLGGAFGFSVPEPVAWVSPVYWATDAMGKLGYGSPDVALNAIALAAQALVLCGIGLWFFQRRVEV